MVEYDDLQVSQDHARFSPKGPVSWDEGVDLLVKTVAWCREHGIHKLLIDTTRLSGFLAPDTIDRFYLGKRLANEAAGSIKIAIVANAELVDPAKFGVDVARSRNLAADAFTSEPEALVWLLG